MILQKNLLFYFETSMMLKSFETTLSNNSGFIFPTLRKIMLFSAVNKRFGLMLLGKFNVPVLKPLLINAIA